MICSGHLVAVVLIYFVNLMHIHHSSLQSIRAGNIISSNINIESSGINYDELSKTLHTLKNKSLGLTSKLQN